jgi:CheY-like chemotaxis protein
MRSEIVLFVFPFQDVIDRLCASLLEDGYRSITAKSPPEARLRMASLPFLSPDLVITHADMMPALRVIIEEWTYEPIPYVLLTSDDPQSHADVIGDEYVVGHLPPPYEPDALLQCLSVATFPAQRGSIPTISPAVLLNTLTDERKTGTIVFTRGAECISVRFRDGMLVGATGVSGSPREVLHYLLTWSDGRFRVALEPGQDAYDVNESTERLVLPGVRRAFGVR